MLTHDFQGSSSTSLLVPDAASHVKSLSLLHEPCTASVPDVDGEAQVQDETVSRVHACPCQLGLWSGDEREEVRGILLVLCCVIHR